MSIVERLYAPISERPSPDAAIDAFDIKDNAIALRRRAAGSSFFRAMQLLPARRCEAMRALCAFCREVGDIADGEASRSLKQTLLSNWRSEIAHLFAGRPQHDVTRGLSEAIHLYGLRCDDFLAIIDGMEMDARRDIRAPSFAELDRYCERVAVAVGRISVRIFGETSPAASGLQQNSAGRCSSPTSFAISPKMRSDTGSTCLASCCTRTAYSQLCRAGCWHSRRSPTSATTWLCSLKDIMWPPPRQLLLALAGRCGPPPSCSGFIGPFSTGSLRVAGGSLTSQYESLPGANSPS
jgi:hypothetical protein